MVESSETEKLLVQIEVNKETDTSENHILEEFGDAHYDGCIKTNNQYLIFIKLFDIFMLILYISYVHIQNQISFCMQFLAFCNI